MQRRIDAAKEHAKLNGLDNCEFYCGDMKDVFTEEFCQSSKTKCFVTDPPRDGMHQKVVEQILKLAPPKLSMLAVILLLKPEI